MSEEGDPEQRKPSSNLQVRNLQRRVKVDSRSLRSFLRQIVAELDPENRNVALALIGDERMRALNRIFRGFDRTTDVLSFRATPALSPHDEPYLGDIVISVETARRQALRRRSNLSRELRVLTLHAYLHLLGYDHETDDGRMTRLEYRLRRKFGITRSGKKNTAYTQTKARKK